MKVLKDNIIVKLVIKKKHKKDPEMIFSVIKNIKKIKRQYFLKAHHHSLKLLKK